MGKRSDFPRLPQDSYDTPESAVAPLLDHLGRSIRFIEPCVGNGYLIGHLKRAGHVCVGAYDLPDDARTMRYVDAQVSLSDLPFEEVTFITNPPWSRPVLHPLIENLANQASDMAAA
jgi:hypothetical protein